MVQAPQEPLLIDWLSELRPGDTFCAREVVERLADAWDGSAVEKLLAELVRWRALEVDFGGGTGTTQDDVTGAGRPQ